MLLLAAVQVTLVARDQIAVIHAAREGARAAAVSAAPAAAASAAARDAVRLDPLQVTTSAGGRVITTVRYRSITDVPLIGALLPDVTLSATATMRREPR